MPVRTMTIALTHENADFDAVSALLGAAKLYPKTIPVLPRHVNRNVRHFLTLYDEDLPMVQVDDLPRDYISRVILVDTQAMVTIRRMEQDLQVQIIDHHPLSRELPPGWAYSGETVGAVTTLLVEQIIEHRYPASPIEATLFLLGIYEDTGSLSYHTTTPRDVRCAAWLLEQGARLDIANDFLHYPLTNDQRKLYDLFLENAETLTFAGQSVVVVAISFPRYVEEVSVLAHKLRDVLDPVALFLLVQFSDQVQLIARSTSDAIDVSRIASGLGGGGHSRASAALIRGMDLQEAKSRLLALLAEHVRPAITVRQIMSFGVRTVSPTTTVAEAAEQMRRYGHEGFPVLENGLVVGMLTRREIDRAMRLGLANAPISMYMTKGPIAVHPDDAIETLQQVMIEHGVGQVPVVSDSGQILGIVTRTDLINLLLSTPERRDRRSRREEISDKLAQMISKDKLDLLWQAAECARSLGYALYIVGGFVRDLLLGRENLDIDLVVEGDAIALARRLAEENGGRVRSHAPFGTAKWILQGGESLDLVSARREFYPYPTALPQVERSSIKHDLHRRDFAINTLAIRLDRDHYGELLDFYEGEQDLRNGLIRVLHSLSLVEDPTRILRAVRLEQRLGFQIEPRTRELIANALGLLPRVSGERIRHELYLLFQEQEPESGLARMQELGILHQIHPGLRCDGWLQDKFRMLRQVMSQWYEQSWQPSIVLEEHDTLHGMPLPVNNAPQLYMALLSYRLIRPELDDLITQIRLVSDDARLLEEVASLRDVLASLQVAELPPSKVVRLLEPYSGPAILVAWVATESGRVREHLSHYWQTYRHVKPSLTGNDLKAMGLTPGPVFGRILSALRDARLDREISSEEEERRVVQEMIGSDAGRRER
ncbi:MAG: CBS domain-containing protein [Anaerolineae bacterium]|nr:CBS domain-containing protein [Anaerolineae bacterium]